MVRVSFAALAIMALLFSVIPDPGCLVTAANAGRLKAGMAHEQMFEIVGAPAPPAFQGEDHAAFCVIATSSLPRASPGRIAPSE